jgi:hypothetical protein
MKPLCHYLLTDHKVNREMKWLAGWAKGELAPSYSCVRALFNSGNVEFGLQNPDLVFETTIYSVEKQPKKLGAFPSH